MDIRKELNKLSVPQLKELARKHNAHYIIRLGVRKVELVEKIASLYESMRDEYLSSRPYEINVKNPKMNVIRKRATPAPVKAMEAPKQKPKAGVDLLAKLEMGLDEREKEIEKIKTGMQEILKNKNILQTQKLKQEYDEKKKKKIEKETQDFLNQTIKLINVSMEVLSDKEEKHKQYGNDFYSSVRTLRALEKDAEKEKKPWQMELLKKYNNLLQTNKLFASRMKKYVPK